MTDRATTGHPTTDDPMPAGPLLETKFNVPTGHGRLVPRTRLSTQAGRATAATLTLISAPAGFGKTTVMAELARGANDDAVTAWLSLDRADNDPVTFWTYVIEAIERAAPGLGSSARSILAGSPGAVEVALTALLNSLAASPVDIVLVLDDAHVIESPTIHEQLDYFLDHLPERGHVVIGTRADPAIPLARLRARRELVEIRASDLRFSAEETADYLGLMDLSLRAEDVATLEGRTEGWIAALQLAALSLQGRADPSEFIDAFAGDDRYIVDYLVEEVLRRPSTERREFLLKTSILGRFTAALADAVTGRGDGRATIDALDRANLFLVALDDQRRWYRYHHLFGGVLQAYLADELPGEVATLHHRASEWHEAHGDSGEAIQHALGAGDADRAAELVERAFPALRQVRREPTLRAWLDAIPREVIDRRPVLAVAYAGAILSANETAGIAELLARAEELIAGDPDPSGSGRYAVVDLEEFRRLPAMIELYRAGVAKMHGDLEGNIAHARRVLDLVGESDHVGRGGAAAFLGLAYWGMGDLEAGERWYAEGMADLAKAGHVTDQVGGAIVRADMRLVEGRLGDAARIYEEGLALAHRFEPWLRGVVDMHTGLADIAYRRGHLAEARAQLDAGRRLSHDRAFPRDPYRSRVVEALIMQAEGDIDPALALLREAERLYLSEFSPDIWPVAALRARVSIAHGRLADARGWAKQQDLSTADPITHVHEFELLTLARLLVAEASEGRADRLPDALGLLDRLVAGAAEGGRHGSRLESLVVQALARHVADDATGAGESLAAAIEIAEPEGYVRVFLDAGPAMVRLLQSEARRPDAPAYVRSLVGAAGRGPERAATGPDHGRGQRLVEPLSERELEVLRLLRSELDGPAIALELVVSLNTLRTHTKNIYAKLGVGSRRAAVRRAEELGLR